MIKELIKICFIIGLLYGLYKVASYWPTESVITLGVVVTFIIIYWLLKLE
jgi:hypothetical protein